MRMHTSDTESSVTLDAAVECLKKLKPLQVLVTYTNAQPGVLCHSGVRLQWSALVAEELLEKKVPG